MSWQMTWSTKTKTENTQSYKGRCPLSGPYMTMASAWVLNLTGISRCGTSLSKLWRLGLSTHPVCCGAWHSHVSTHPVIFGAWHAQVWQESPLPLVELNSILSVLKISTFWGRCLRLQECTLRMITASNLAKGFAEDTLLTVVLSWKALQIWGNMVIPFVSALPTRSRKNQLASSVSFL